MTLKEEMIKKLALKRKSDRIAQLQHQMDKLNNELNLSDGLDKLIVTPFPPPRSDALYRVKYTSITTIISSRFEGNIKKVIQKSIWWGNQALISRTSYPLVTLK